MKKKIYNFVKMHMFLTAFLIFLILIILPPILINVLYKIPVFWFMPQNEIPPENLLSYLGTVLTFCATFSLSMIVYIQNKEKNIVEKLITNEASIAIIEGGTAEIEIFNNLKAAPDFNFVFEIRVFSKAKISSINLISISFSNYSFDDKRISVNVEKHNEKFLTKNKTESDIELSTGSMEISNELKTFLIEKNKLNIKMKIKVISNDVITPINIILELKKQNTIKNNTFEYSVETSDIFNCKPEIRENN